MKFARKRLYDTQKYWVIRQSLDKEEKRKILKIEKLCLKRNLRNARKDYFFVYRMAYEIFFGGPPPHPIVYIGPKRLMMDLVLYLIKRSGELRGIKFSK